ncbi:Malate dehydrogenase, cytoplasmic [Aduncisulcus paluster]|uniref:Malate dehydrogenase, cytoplasmic n=1 Tax=Aduncisulcus paluster TaxID=2918883 RepID=A0ABQ5KKU7_9EUKA|nr:Malate dehydrogenase, cytoplasmic [Aduncisulcus paluster]
MFSSSFKEPLRVVVSGAAGQISYSGLLSKLLNGDCFGRDTPIELRLLEIPPAVRACEGVVKELHDCAFPLLKDIKITTEADEAFDGVDYAFLVGAFPRKKGMERSDLLQRNKDIFVKQGKSLNRFGKETTKVVVVGNPANTNALICSEYAHSLPKKNFSCMSRLDHNRTISQVAKHTGATHVKNCCIFGNHSPTMVPVVEPATLETKEGLTVAADCLLTSVSKEMITDTVRQRGSEIIAFRGLSSALSAAKAAVDHVKDWASGTQPGEFVSMGVCSDGSYGVPEGLFSSYPVVCKGGEWSIVHGLGLSEAQKEAIEISAKELLKEAEMVL